MSDRPRRRCDHCGVWTQSRTGTCQPCERGLVESGDPNALPEDGHWALDPRTRVMRWHAPPRQMKYDDLVRERYDECGWWARGARPLEDAPSSQDARWDEFTAEVDAWDGRSHSRGHWKKPEKRAERDEREAS